MTYRKRLTRTTKACERQDKVAYPTEAEARDALGVLASVLHRKHLRVYRCPGGPSPHWHIGKGGRHKRRRP